jgi:hypothetical protein
VFPFVLTKNKQNINIQLAIDKYDFGTRPLHKTTQSVLTTKVLNKIKFDEKTNAVVKNT